MMDTFAELYEECKSTTVNLRVLWTDKVRNSFLVPYPPPPPFSVLIRMFQYMTMDSEHMKHIYNAGFNKFWRGHTQKEMV